MDHDDIKRAERLRKDAIPGLVGQQSTVLRGCACKTGMMVKSRAAEWVAASNLDISGREGHSMSVFVRVTQPAHDVKGPSACRIIALLVLRVVEFLHKLTLFFPLFLGEFGDRATCLREQQGCL